MNTRNIKVFVYKDNIGVPYKLLSSSNRYTVPLEGRISIIFLLFLTERKLLIVANDIFDNFMELN